MKDEQSSVKRQIEWSNELGILIFKLKVIDPESQHLTSDER